MKCAKYNPVLISVIACPALILLSCSRPMSAENEADQTTNKTTEVKTVKIIEHKSGAWTPDLSDDEKMTVFKITEDSLEWCVKGRMREEFDFKKYDLTDKLKKPTHSFVTLKIGDDLRGCIGSLPPYKAEPMYISVHQHAVYAALRDTRFNPVSAKELPSINIHVSLLSDSTNISSVNDFKIGEHGIIMEKDGSRAVFLPEVAVEQKWTREVTLSYLSMKAGLPEDAWKTNAHFKVFTSVVLEKK